MSDDLFGDAPRDVFADPALLRRSNIEPPVLAELFERLEASGLALGRPMTVEEAAAALAAWSARERATPVR